MTTIPDEPAVSPDQPGEPSEPGVDPDGEPQTGEPGTGEPGTGKPDAGTSTESNDAEPFAPVDPEEV